MDYENGYLKGYEKGYSQSKYGFQCAFACITNLPINFRVIEYYLDCFGLRDGVKIDPVPPEDLDYARGYMDGYARAKDKECEGCGKEASQERHGEPVCDSCARLSDAIDAEELKNS